MINLDWRLVSDTTGSTVASASGCADKQIDGVPAGTYRLIVTPGNQRGGTYTMDLFTVDPPQVFDVDLATPLPVSNGVPAAGAGNLETVASQDQYCPGVINLAWKLVVDGTGAVIDSMTGCASKQVVPLAAGTYRVVVTPQNQTGTYAMRIYNPALPH